MCFIQVFKSDDWIASVNVECRHLLQRRVEKEESDETTVDLARVMFDTAILRSGYTLICRTQALSLVVLRECFN